MSNPPSQLTFNDISLLRRYRLKEALRTFLLITLVICFAVIFFDYVFGYRVLQSNASILIGILLIFWITLFLKSPQNYLKIGSDIRGGEAKFVDGLINVQVHRGIGLIAPLKQIISVNGMRLNTHLELLKLSGAEISAKFAPTSKVLLSYKIHNELDSKRLFDDKTSLTEGECSLLKMIANGLPDKLIARELDLAPSTVRTYNSKLFKKIGANSRKQAVEIAKKEGWLDVD
jgi:DNA-binding CsgD family transcriptional regulator